MACAGSTERAATVPDEPATAPDEPAGSAPIEVGCSDRIDESRAYELHPQVTIRPEPFGALAYHYGNRRLTFLRSPGLVRLVEGLAARPNAGAALDAAGLRGTSRATYLRALASLEQSEVIRAR